MLMFPENGVFGNFDRQRHPISLELVEKPTLRELWLIDG
jgi:hypothetical protein